MAAQFPWGETIEVRAELGFLVNGFILDSSVLNGVQVLDGTLEGLDISTFVQAATISRGRQDQFSGFGAGTLSLSLLNNDRRFDPLNEDSPYYDPATGRSGVVPRRKVSVVADGEFLFVGRIVDLDVDYDMGPAGEDRSTATITCADDFQRLANTSIETAVVPVEQLSGARVSFLLDLPEVSYPASSRNIDPGTATLGAYPVSENANALAYLQRIAEAEQGLCFVSRDGTLTFQDRATLGFSAPQESFTDSGIGIPYQTLAIRYGSEIMFNRVVVTTEGGIPQVADDAAAQSEFGIQTLTLTDNLLSDEPQALTLAQAIVTEFSEPQYKFDSLSVILNDKVFGDRASLLALELGKQVEITRTFATGDPLQVTEVYQVNQIRHSLSPSRHTIEYGLGWIAIVFPFVLDDVQFGLLDDDNAVV